MKREITPKNGTHICRSQWLALVMGVCAGAVLIVFLANRIERSIKDDHLAQALIIAQTIQYAHVHSLPRDEKVSLNTYLAAINTSDKAYRIIEVLQDDSVGIPFIHLATDPAYPLIDQIYNEILTDYGHVSKATSAHVLGPLRHKRGAHIMSIVPLTHTDTGETFAIIGIESDARHWQWRVWTRAIGITTLIVFAAIMAFICIRWSRNAIANYIRMTRTQDTRGSTRLLEAFITDATGFKRNEDICNFHSQVLDSLDEAIVVTDLKGTVLYWGRGAEAMYGYPANEVLGRPYRHFAGSVESNDENDFIRQILAQGSWKGEHYQRRRDGSYIWTSVYISVLRNAEGEAIGFIGLDHDITEKKRAETALQASEKRAAHQRSTIADLVLNTPVTEGDISCVLDRFTSNIAETLKVARASIWMLKDDNTKLVCSSLYEADRNTHSSGDVLLLADFPLYFREILTGHRLYARDVQNDSRTRELTDVYLKPHGITSLLDAGIFIEGKLVGVVCSEHIGPLRVWHQDEEAFVSTIAALIAQLLIDAERKKALKAIKESEDKLRQVIDLVPHFIFAKNAEGSFILANKAVADVYATTTDNLIGKKDSDFNPHTDEVKHFTDDDKRVIESGKGVYGIEEVITDADGIQRYLETSKIPFTSSTTEKPSILGVSVDITARKRAEEEREMLQTQLAHAQKMESIGRLAGGVAHDFNNMLGVILGHTELALEHLESNEILRAHLQEIQNAGQHSADLTRQLLAFARKQTVSPAPLNLNEKVADMLNMLRVVIGEDIQLVWKPGNKLWTICMDFAQLDRILTNLCLNARDAIGSIGTITIETENIVLDIDYCTRHPGCTPGEYVQLTISDDGHGMDAETLAHVFEPFFTTKEPGKGTGLGLASVHGVVAQNKGFIHISSEPERGTIFQIYFPRHHHTVAQKPEEHTSTVSAQQRRTILIVEDEPKVLKMTTMVVESLGYTVLAAASPKEAIDLAADYSDRIDLLMTDVVMPEMNGRNLATHLRPICPHLKCLFMSGYTADVIAYQGVLDVGVAYIQKPFSKTEIAATLRDVLNS